jgi:hypothetical protein
MLNISTLFFGMALRAPCTRNDLIDNHRGDCKSEQDLAGSSAISNLVNSTEPCLDHPLAILNVLNAGVVLVEFHEKVLNEGVGNVVFVVIIFFI